MKYMSPDRFDALPKAIFFDIDNTLYAYAPAHAKATAQVIKKASSLYLIGEKDFSAAFREARAQTKQRLGHTASGHSRLLYFQRTLEILELGAQIVTALDLEQTYWRSFLLEAKLFDGVLEAFNEIRVHGIPLALVTDLTAQIQMRKVVHFGLDKYIDVFVTSEESGADKDQPQSYLLAVEKTGAQGGPVWMVGDNPQKDIAGARRAIDAVTLQKLHKGVETDDNAMPDATFSSFSELIALISSLGHAGTTSS